MAKIQFVLHGSEGYEDSLLRASGGPGSGWTSENGHVAGSQGGKNDPNHASEGKGFHVNAHGGALVAQALNSGKSSKIGIYRNGEQRQAMKQAHETLTHFGFKFVGARGPDSDVQRVYSHPDGRRVSLEKIGSGKEGSVSVSHLNE